MTSSLTNGYGGDHHTSASSEQQAATSRLLTFFANRSIPSASTSTSQQQQDQSDISFIATFFENPDAGAGAQSNSSSTMISASVADAILNNPLIYATMIKWMLMPSFATKKDPLCLCLFNCIQQAAANVTANQSQSTSGSGSSPATSHHAISSQQQLAYSFVPLLVWHYLQLANSTSASHLSAMLQGAGTGTSTTHSSTKHRISGLEACLLAAYNKKALSNEPVQIVQPAMERSSLFHSPARASNKSTLTQSALRNLNLASERVVTLEPALGPFTQINASNRWKILEVIWDLYNECAPTLPPLVQTFTCQAVAHLITSGFKTSSSTASSFQSISPKSFFNTTSSSVVASPSRTEGMTESASAMSATEEHDHANQSEHGGVTKALTATASASVSVSAKKKRPGSAKRKQVQKVTKTSGSSTPARGTSSSPSENLANSESVDIGHVELTESSSHHETGAGVGLDVTPAKKPTRESPMELMDHPTPMKAALGISTAMDAPVEEVLSAGETEDLRSPTLTETTETETSTRQQSQLQVPGGVTSPQPSGQLFVEVVSEFDGYRPATFLESSAYTEYRRFQLPASFITKFVTSLSYAAANSNAGTKSAAVNAAQVLKTRAEYELWPSVLLQVNALLSLYPGGDVQ